MSDNRIPSMAIPTSRLWLAFCLLSASPAAAQYDNVPLVGNEVIQLNQGGRSTTTTGAIAALANATTFPAAGGTFTGAVNFNSDITTFGTNTGAPVLHINGAAGSLRGIEWDAAGVNRWKLQTDSSGDLNLFAYAQSGGAFAGTPMSFNTVQAVDLFGWKHLHTVTASSMPADTIVGRSATYTNTSGAVGQGAKQVYFSNAVAAGFDLSNVNFMIPTATTGFPGSGTTAFQGQWLVALSPNEQTGLHWSITGMELDVVNRGLDRGWANSLSQINGSGAYLAVPEATTFGQGGATNNALYAFAVHGSIGNGSSGFTNKFYNGLLCDIGSIGPAGYCVYGSGDATGTAALFPASPAGFAGNWLHGIDLTGATFADGAGLRMASGHAVAWPAGGGFVSGAGAGGNGTVSLEYAGTGEIDLRDAQANPRAKMTSAAVDLGVAGTGANFRVSNTVTNLVTTDLTGWTAGAGNNTVTNNVATAPDGTLTAAFMATSATNNLQTRFKAFTGVNGTLASMTVYAATQPGSTYPYVIITFSGAGFSNNTYGIVVNTTTCAFANYAFANPAAAPTSYQVTSTGNGWCRVSMQERVTSGSASWVALVGNAQGFTPIFAGDGTGIYVWQPVVETVTENFVRATGAIAGGDATLTAADSGDTNASVLISGKGKGGLKVPLTTPSSSSDTCAAGQIDADTGFVYVCTAANTWKRAALSTF